MGKERRRRDGVTGEELQEQQPETSMCTMRDEAGDFTSVTVQAYMS